MIHIECIQGGEEWRMLRLGLCTASNFSRIITTKKMEPAAARHRSRRNIHDLDRPLSHDHGAGNLGDGLSA